MAGYGEDRYRDGGDYSGDYVGNTGYVDPNTVPQGTQSPTTQQFWSDRVQRALNSMTPRQRQEAIDSWAGNPATAEAWYDNAARQGAIRESATDLWSDQGRGDVYSQRDWAGAPNAGDFDAQYQRLIGMGIPPERARRIVSIAIGGTEHDWQQYGGGGQYRWQDPNDAYYGMTMDQWVDNFIAGDDKYDYSCPQEAPYRSAEGTCVEKPWDTGEDPNAPAHPGGRGGGEAAGGGMEASPASQAAVGNAPTPTGGYSGTVGVTGVWGPGSQGFQTGQTQGTVNRSNVAGGGAPPIQTPRITDAWTATGAGGGGQGGGQDFKSPYETTNPGSFTSFSTGTGNRSSSNRNSGWSNSGGGSWVASDERLKDLGLQHKKVVRFSDWRNL